MADLGGAGSFKNFVLPALALVVLGALYFAQKQVLQETPETPATAGDRKTAPAGDRKTAPADAKTTPAAKADGAASAGGTRDPERRARRDQMLKQLQAALTRRGVPEEGSAGASEADAKAGADTKRPAGSPPRTLDPEYIRQRIKDDLVPLARECYESALEDDAALAGRLVMKFAIAGDEDIGGVVDEVELGEDSDIKHPELLECLRESMYTVTFDPPEGYGRVDVTYPIVFAQEPPAGAAEAE